MAYDMIYDAIDIPKDWYKMGREKDGTEPSEVAFRFISFLIAFNGYYSRVCGGNEQSQIKDFMNKKGEELSTLFNFDTDPRLAVFRDSPVFEQNYGAKNG